MHETEGVISVEESVHEPTDVSQAGRCRRNRHIGEWMRDASRADGDCVSALPADEHGFRGAVHLKRGRYELDHPITVAASGVVLRGEGQDDTGTILYGLIPAGEPVKSCGRGRIILSTLDLLTPVRENARPALVAKRILLNYLGFVSKQ